MWNGRRRWRSGSPRSGHGTDASGAFDLRAPETDTPDSEMRRSSSYLPASRNTLNVLRICPRRGHALMARRAHRPRSTVFRIRKSTSSNEEVAASCVGFVPLASSLRAGDQFRSPRGAPVPRAVWGGLAVMAWLPQRGVGPEAPQAASRRGLLHLLDAVTSPQ